MTNPVPIAYTRRRVRDRIRAYVLDDSVLRFVWLFYGSFFLWGLWATFWAYPVDLVIDPMGRWVYDAWAWIPLVSMPSALIGLALRHGGSAADEIKGPLLRRDFLGLWMQIGGHVCQAITLTVYIGAGIFAATTRQPIISVFVFVPYLVSVIILTLQCLYKVRLGRPRE